MSLYAQIITDDARFARMLAHELSDIGIEAISNTEWGEKKITYIIADLDFFNTEELEKYINDYSIIGFSRSNYDELGAVADKLTCFLHRPFLMTDFRKAFTGIDTHATNKSHEIKSRAHHSKAPTYQLVLNHKTQSAKIGDLNITFSEYEFKVLSKLFDCRGKVVMREEIQALLGFDAGNMGDVYICHLRRKIDNKLGLKLIYTIRGKGYMLK